MYDPEGYLPIHDIVVWVAGLGAEGKLPRRFGFVHPGDAPSPYDLPPDENARRIIGGKLAADVLAAIARIYPSGQRLRVPSDYWGSIDAETTMRSGRLQVGNLWAEVFLAVDAVAAALGFSLAPPDEPAPPTLKPLETSSAAQRGRSYRKDDEPLIAEMRAMILAGSDKSARSAARAVVHKATGDGTEDSKVERLANLYSQKHGGLE